MSISRGLWPKLDDEKGGTAEEIPSENIESPVGTWLEDHFVTFSDFHVERQHSNRDGHNGLNSFSPHEETPIKSTRNYFPADSYRHEDREDFSKNVLNLSPIQEEKECLITSQSKPSKLRTSIIARLNCTRPSHQSFDETEIHLLGDPSPSMQLLGAAAHPFPLDEEDNDDDIDDHPTYFAAQGNSVYRWMQLSQLFPLSQTDMPAVAEDLGETYTNTKDVNHSNNECFDDKSLDSLVGDFEDETSSLAGCKIDMKLAQALSFHCSPDKKSLRSLSEMDYGIAVSEKRCSYVAERRNWLLDAFKSRTSSKGQNSDICLSTGAQNDKRRIINCHPKPSKISKALVAQRKLEWENKISANCSGRVTSKNQLDSPYI